jgi:hypothetical protein
MRDAPEPQVTATKTPDGWKLEINDVAWDLIQEAVMMAVSSAIREGDLTGRRALPFRQLRTALERAQRGSDW